jgi:UDP-galactopyranose mutase
MKKVDYLIVGVGFSGAVLAERLKSINKKVLIIEKRNHIGGNSYDYYDDYGVLIHKYGPHYFRTDSDKVFQYLSKFTKWRPCKYRIRVFIDGELYPFPINRDTINKFFNLNLKSEQEVKEFLNQKKVNIKYPKNAEEQVLSTLGRDLYEKFFKNYTIKQWHTDPKNLDASVITRIPIRYNTNDIYFDERIQAIPLNGYHELFKNLLKGIEIWLNVEYNKIKDEISYRNLIYTAPIDEFFNFKYGKLPYRSLKFVNESYKQDYYQDWVQINYPNDFNYTRIVEIKHVTKQKCANTTIVKEFPSDKGEPFYPIPFYKNYDLYQKYNQDANKLKNVYFIGRLARYRYLNMDQVVKQALNLFKMIKKK